MSDDTRIRITPTETTGSELPPRQPSPPRTAAEQWRYAYAAATRPGLPWDIYTATGDLTDWLVGSVAEESDAAAIVEQHNAAIEAEAAAPAGEPRTPHVHIIPLGYGDHEAAEGETYSLVQCRECLEMIAVAPGARALAEAAAPAGLDRACAHCTEPQEHIAARLSSARSAEGSE